MFLVVSEMTLLLVLILLNIFSSRNYNKICRFKSVSQTDKQTYIFLLICKKKKKKTTSTTKRLILRTKFCLFLEKTRMRKKLDTCIQKKYLNKKQKIKRTNQKAIVIILK